MLSSTPSSPILRGSRWPIRALLPLLLVVACNPENKPVVVDDPPVVSISAPTEGSEVDEGVQVEMIGHVADDAYSETLSQLTPTWTVNGALVCDDAAFDDGGISRCIHVFSPPDATITLTATDPNGQAASAEVGILVAPNAAPNAEILAPVDGDQFYSDYPVVFTGLATDTEDPADQLTVTFESDRSGVLAIDETPTSAGQVSGSLYMEEGSHFVTMTVADTTGRTGEDTVSFFVQGPNGIPDCSITAPASGGTYSTGDPILLEGTASDPDIPANTLNVSWTSDKDGSLGASTPSSAGEFFLSTASLSTNVHTITLSVSDEVGALCTDAILLQVGNGPSVRLDSPSTGSTVNDGEDVTFSATVSDAEDVATSLVFAWESDVEGVFSTQGANSSGLSSFTYDGLSIGTHTITVSVTDTDGITSIDRATITVNGLPTAPGVALSPDPGDSGQNLVANVTAASVDYEGDPVTYRYEWYRNGVLTAETSNTVAPGTHAVGESWEVRVYATDGYGESAPGIDATTIGNGAPSLTSVTITPSAPYTTDTLTAVPSGWSDPDGDAENYEYQWSKNGTAISGATDSTLDGSYFVRDDVILVTVTPYDGTSRGTPITSGARTILNAPPSTPTVAIYPEQPEDDDSFACSVVGASTDADGDAITYTYAWTRNGTASAVVTANVDASYTSMGDLWVCAVSATDGTDSASPATDSVTVGDYTAPGQPNLSSVNAYRNEDWVAVSGTAEADVDITFYVTTSSGTNTYATTANSSGSFTYTFSGLTRGATYSIYAIATDDASNSSSASNTLSTEVCSPYDDYDLAGLGGNECADAIVDWSSLPDSGSTVIEIVGNILDGADSDWYLVQTSDALSAGINYYRFRVQMTHGSGNYAFVVHDGGCADAYLDCSSGGYTEYQVFAQDVNDSGHGIPGDYRYCNYGSSPLYNDCDDLSSDYYIEVFRTSSSYNCEYYELEVSNGVW